MYYNQGNYSDALNYFKCSLEIQKLIHHGKGNIDTASTLDYIGHAYYEQENYELAVEYF